MEIKTYSTKDLEDSLASQSAMFRARKKTVGSILSPSNYENWDPFNDYSKEHRALFVGREAKYGSFVKVVSAQPSESVTPAAVYNLLLHDVGPQTLNEFEPEKGVYAGSFTFDQREGAHGFVAFKTIADGNYISFIIDDALSIAKKISQKTNGRVRYAVVIPRRLDGEVKNEYSQPLRGSIDGSAEPSGRITDEETIRRMTFAASGGLERAICYDLQNNPEEKI